MTFVLVKKYNMWQSLVIKDCYRILRFVVGFRICDICVNNILLPNLKVEVFIVVHGHGSQTPKK